MATSLYMLANSFKARIEGLQKDAREFSTKAAGLGNVANIDEAKMAAKIIEDACAKASKYLQKASSVKR